MLFGIALGLLVFGHGIGLGFDMNSIFIIYEIDDCLAAFYLEHGMA